VAQVDFYHLTHSPVERVLPRIAERVLAYGGRLLIVSGDDMLAERLDGHLWNYRPESFLPHGRAGKPGEADQPVLIGATCDAVNGARNIALADGVWREEALNSDRAFLFFSDDRITEARATWRALAAQPDLERRYWKQDEAGKWSREA
jgi:DNA polymerase III subunit chi